MGAIIFVAFIIVLAAASPWVAAYFTTTEYHPDAD